MRKVFLPTLLIVLLASALLVPVATAGVAPQAASVGQGPQVPPAPPSPPTPVMPATPADGEGVEDWLAHWTAENAAAVVAWYNGNASTYAEEQGMERPPSAPPEHPLPDASEDKVAWAVSFLNTMQPWLRDEFLRFVLSHVESPESFGDCHRLYVPGGGGRPLTPFPVCAGFKDDGCDAYARALFVSCVRDFFPEDW